VSCPFCGAERHEARDRSGIKRAVTAVTIASVLAISCGGYGGSYPLPVDAPASDGHKADAAKDAPAAQAAGESQTQSQTIEAPPDQSR
jgi:hypothetical protein